MLLTCTRWKQSGTPPQNFLLFGAWVCKLRVMVEPLALVAYERMMPGSQLLVKLRDLGYRSEHVARLRDLPVAAAEKKPLVVLIDLLWRVGDSLDAIARLSNDPDTAHLPIVAYADMRNENLLEQALHKGAALVTGDDGVLAQLARLLDQALEVD